MRKINRRKFLIRLGEAAPFAALGVFLLSDKSNLTRSDLIPAEGGETVLRPDEIGILGLASLAPSGHNTQPWFIEYIEPFHWIIGNESSRWLPAVDPTQRETVLSLGAFAENLERAGAHYGYHADWYQIATTNQEERMLELRLIKSGASIGSDAERIRTRRTLRGKFSSTPLAGDDLKHLFNGEDQQFHFIPADGREGKWINEATIEANRHQAYREPAQHELSDWVRFSNREARKFRDGLTTGSMEIEGASGWFVRNLYIRENVLSADFRERGIARVREQVAAHGGWILITSPDNSTPSLIDAGRRFQRMFLSVRERNIGIHPMTQILEEEPTRNNLAGAIGINDPIQFIVRAGYTDSYPDPVSLRRPPEWFVRT